MGCDIHMRVEVRRDGKWERVEQVPTRPCSWREEGDHAGCWNCQGTGVVQRPYHDRNYTVFSVLAGVRNDGYVTPIAAPRGLPDDVTRAAPKVNEDGDDESQWEYGDHSFSWLTVAEVLAYDWQRQLKDEGWVDKATFAKWDAAGASGGPDGMYSKSVAGGLVRHVSHSDMRRRIAKPYPWEYNDAPYTPLQWTVKVADYCEHFLAFVNSLAPLGEPSEIRLVFGFDS